MIELSISSARACALLPLMQTLKIHGVRARVTETMSTVAHRETDDAPEQTLIEAGFHLLVTNVEADEFRARVWEPLARLMPITCAHVRDGERYTGCFSNWPGVSVASRCNERGVVGWEAPEGAALVNAGTSP